MSTLVDPDDQKLVTLARSVRSRTRAAEGAAIRDTDGRTYAAATVALASFAASAVQVAVAMAVSSGSRGLEAVLLLGEATTPGEQDLAVVRDFAGTGVPVHLCDARGALVETVTS